MRPQMQKMVRKMTGGPLDDGDAGSRVPLLLLLGELGTSVLPLQLLADEMLTGVFVDGRLARSSGTSDIIGRRGDEPAEASGGVVDGRPGRSSGTSGFTGWLVGERVYVISSGCKISRGSLVAICP